MYSFFCRFLVPVEGVTFVFVEEGFRKVVWISYVDQVK
jgi:hypothetical protein